VFCTNLTGISRQTIETHGRALQSVVTRIEEVCRGLGSSRVTLCCDGRWDVHFMLQKELRSKAIVVSVWWLCVCVCVCVG
jgi:inhibitor of KinA sporulation pathway (predicted exonuclease)